MRPFFLEGRKMKKRDSKGVYVGWLRNMNEFLRLGVPEFETEVFFSFCFLGDESPTKSMTCCESR